MPCSLWGRNAVGAADGSDWRQYSQTYKVGWIDGFVAAMDDAQFGTAALCAFQLHVTLESEEGKACTAEAQSYNFEMVKYGQFLDGMDAFYKDFRNMEVPTNTAIRIVRDQIRGRPAKRNWFLGVNATLIVASAALRQVRSRQRPPQKRRRRSEPSAVVPAVTGVIMASCTTRTKALP